MKALILLFSLLLYSSTLLAQEKEWTLLIYLSADNNLSRYMKTIVQRLQKIRPNKMVNVVIQYDGDQLNDSSRLIISGNKTISVVSGIEYDMGDPSTLADFVAWGLRSFPAKRHALFVSAHGRGILNLAVNDGSFKGDDSQTLASSPDDSAKSYMHEEDMARALENVLQGEKFDLFVYNSCLMGNFEVLQALKPIAHYAIASEYMITIQVDQTLTKQEAAGIPFNSTLKALNRSPKMEAKTLGETIVSFWQSSYEDFFSYSWGREKKELYPATLALFDLDQIALIEQALQDLSSKILASDITTFDRIFYQLLKTPTIQGDHYIDLGNLMQAIYHATHFSEAKIIENLLSNNSFILKRSLINVDATAGVSILFPNGKVIDGNDYLLNNALNFYSSLNLVQQTNWAQLVLSYLHAIRERKPNLLVGLVEDFLKSKNLPQLTTTTNPQYNEYYLFLLAEIAFYPLLAQQDYQLLNKYIHLLAATDYSSETFKKHCLDMKKLIERQLASDPVNQQFLNSLLLLLK